MKYCPSCKRDYRDETLRFCLNDGALLVSGPPSEPTIVAVPPPLNLPPTVWQSPSQSNQSTRATSNSALTYVVIGLVVVLAFVVGGVFVFLLGQSGPTSPNNANNSSASLTPSPADNRQVTRASTPEDQRSPAAGIYDAAEQIVVRGERLSRSDLDQLSQVELRRLRNTIYARHGRMFNTPELQRFFDGRPWYTRRFEYNDRDLSATDKANLNLIVINEGNVP